MDGKLITLGGAYPFEKAATDRVKRWILGSGLSGLATVLRVGIGILFLYASISKLIQPYGFLSTVFGFELFPQTTGILVAVVVPWVELLVGLCLVANVVVGGSLVTANVLFLGLLTIQGWVLHQGLAVTAGWLGALDTRPIDKVSVGVTLVLMAASILCFILTQCQGRRQTKSHSLS